MTFDHWERATEKSFFIEEQGNPGIPAFGSHRAFAAG
jgi:hypothetical protein